MHANPRSVRWPGRRISLTAAGLVALVVAAFGGWQAWQGAQALPTAPVLAAPTIGSAEPPTTMTDGSGLDRSAPVRIGIPAINVNADIDQVGLAPDGTMAEQPLSRANRAAWYRLGPTPGQVGPAVIVGHVDTKHAKAVFYKLNQLRPGDMVSVTRADGRTVTFIVDGLAMYPKDHFPTSKVYAATRYPALRLITCGGSFDTAAGSYVDNIVVYLHMLTT
jgi:hypothetical protein